MFLIHINNVQYLLCSKSADGVKIVDTKDRVIYSRDNQQLVSLNQDGPINGHYMQVDGRDVRTNAMSTNQRSMF